MAFRIVTQLQAWMVNRVLNIDGLPIHSSAPGPERGVSRATGRGTWNLEGKKMAFKTEIVQESLEHLSRIMKWRIREIYNLFLHLPVVAIEAHEDCTAFLIT